MEIAILILLLFLGVTSFALVFLVIWEVKKRNDFSVIAHFITDDKSEQRKRYKNITVQFSFKDETYFYDDKCAVTRGKNKHIFYLKGHSAPIDFTLSDEQLQLKYNSKTIDRLLKNNIIQKMLDDVGNVAKDQEKRIVMYLIFLGIIIIFVLNYLMKNNTMTCQLIQNNQTINLIAEADKQGIR